MARRRYVDFSKIRALAGRFTDSRFLLPPYEGYADKYKRTLMSYLSALPVDRTGAIQDFGFKNIVVEQPFPKLLVNPGDFSGIMDRRAAEIIARSVREQKPIAVLYSGGLDSTAVCCALLKAGATITIAASLASVEENPSFYVDVLCRNKFVKREIGNPLAFLRERSDDFIFVTGECGAHLMGSINWHKFGGRDADIKDEIAADETAAGVFRNTEPYFNLPEQIRAMLMPTLERAPIPIRTNYDAMWWSIFALKWQYVSYRIQMWIGKLVPTLENFFMNNEFQCWAMLNDVRVKCPDFQWRNYKMPIRDYIFAYHGKRSSSYDMPKRASMNLTYYNLSINGVFVLAAPKRLRFLDTGSTRTVERQIFGTRAIAYSLPTLPEKAQA